MQYLLNQEEYERLTPLSEADKNRIKELEKHIKHIREITKSLHPPDFEHRNPKRSLNDLKHQVRIIVNKALDKQPKSCERCEPRIGASCKSCVNFSNFNPIDKP